MGLGEIPKRNGRKSTVLFFSLCIFSLFLRPWVKLEKKTTSQCGRGAGRQATGMPTFPEAPGLKLACGVPTFLSHWAGRRAARLVGPTGRGTWAAAGAAPESPRGFVCVPAQHPFPSPAVRQSSHPEESLCGGAPGEILWIYSVPFLGQDSEEERVQVCVRELFGTEAEDRPIKCNSVYQVLLLMNRVSASGVPVVEASQGLGWDLPGPQTLAAPWWPASGTRAWRWRCCRLADLWWFASGGAAGWPGYLPSSGTPIWGDGVKSRLRWGLEWSPPLIIKLTIKMNDYCVSALKCINVYEWSLSLWNCGWM